MGFTRHAAQSPDGKQSRQVDRGAGKVFFVCGQKAPSARMPDHAGGVLAVPHGLEYRAERLRPLQTEALVGMHAHVLRVEAARRKPRGFRDGLHEQTHVQEKH